MAHPYAKHSESVKSHSRVGHILKSSGNKRGAAHADEAADRNLFQQMMAEQGGGPSGPSETPVGGAKRGGRYARGGRTKQKQGNTNIAVVVPQGRSNAGPQAGGAAVPPTPPVAPPALPPPGLGGPGGPPGLPPGMKPPGMMKRGGRIGGDASSGNLKRWAGRASRNSYARGGRLPDAGALSGEGRLQKAHMK